MNGALLIVNAGSSSLKVALMAADDLAVLARVTVESLAHDARVRATGPRAHAFEAPLAPDADHARAIAWCVDAVHAIDDVPLVAAGHRVVHGGARFDAPVRVTPDVLDALDALVPLAPDHQPHNVRAMRAIAQRWPSLPQVACFDTAFHRTQPRLATLFALPRALSDAGLVRYGFHGLSYEYVAGQLHAAFGIDAEARVIVAHLGHGASLCAMHAGRSVATTMGYTATDGLMMGTRCGSIDPGAVLALVRDGRSVDEVERLLDHDSGLLGVSGISDDVRTLEASDDPRAREALDLFAYRVVRDTGSLVAALGGLDAFVFTAGIGEHAAAMRARIAHGLAWLGLVLDDAANGDGRRCISQASSRVAVYVCSTDEESVIARQTRAQLTDRSVRGTRQ